MKISVVVPSFRGAFRLQRMLESIQLYDPTALSSAQWTVVEDPSDSRATENYIKTLAPFPAIEFVKLPQWSNMHGAAMRAFHHVIDKYDPTWVLYLGDDVMVTPFALTSVFHFLRENELRSIGLVQVPYWNSHELYINQTYSEHKGPQLFHTKEDMYTSDPEWLLRVPRNPHWDGEGFARPYVNVNGCGFAARADNYLAVGGFTEGTWCLDESISVRTWLRGPLGIVCLPGPPFVHYFGGATESDPPPHDLYTAEAWTKAMGLTKEEANVLSYKAMDERTPAMLAETTRANYFTVV